MAPDKRGEAVITGAHSIIYSLNAEADRAVLRDVFKFSHVDVGDGWLIFGLPPSEVAVHPTETSNEHELYLMCDDIEAFVRDMAKRKLECSPVQNQGWGLLTHVTLPGGGLLGVYEPRHARPAPMTAGGARKGARKATGKSSSKRASAKKTRTRARRTRAKRTTR
jgi:hypothetical protein